MKNICKKLGMLCVCTILFTGCGESIYPELPKNPIAFEMGSFTDVNDDNVGYGTIEYNGRIYMSYGALRKTLHKSDIDKCIGYIICDENSSSYTDLSDRTRRVYTLAGDTEENFLMDYLVDDTFMNQPGFWRAIDTKGKSVNQPDCIESLDYELFWK